MWIAIAIAVTFAAPPRTNEPTLTVWPDPTGMPVDGWAGVSYALWGLDGMFSADSKTYLHCGNGPDDCLLLRTGDGSIAKRLQARGGYDDSPEGVLADPAIAGEVERMNRGGGGKIVPWPDPDVSVSWRVEAHADAPSTIVYVAHERTSGAEAELTRFTPVAPDPDLPAAGANVQPVLVAPDSRTVALRALYQQGQSLEVEVRLVATKQLLHDVYTAAAAKDPAHASQWNAKRDAVGAGAR